MNAEKLFEDYTQLYNALLMHPCLIAFPERLAEFKNLYHKEAKKISDYNTFLDAATALTCWFQDGHTNIELPYQDKDRCIPLHCKWNKESLYITKDYQAIPCGAEITKIEDLPLYMVVKRLLPRIPHENIFLVKSRITEYPYRNYHLFSELTLTALFGAKAEYALTYEHDGQSHCVNLGLVPYDGYLDFSDDDFVSWKIEKGHALLKLNACICNQDYTKALDDLAHACQSQNVTDLTLDLSCNMGGTSEVIERFLQHVNVETFHRYEMLDYSNGWPVCVCSRTDAVTNNKQKYLFPKQIISKISNTTFSSARTFAVTLFDNGIATISGEPTGGKPSSYGLPRKSILANTGIRFRVSSAWFGRPNAALDHHITLAPEHYFLSQDG